MPACAFSSSASGAGQPCSTASRNRCSEPTPGLPPQEKISFDAQPAADQLIVDQIRRHADERQIAPPLPDDFVPGGERNQVCEAFQSHHIAVANHFLDRLFEWKNMRQLVIMPRCEGWHLVARALLRAVLAIV